VRQLQELVTVTATTLSSSTTDRVSNPPMLQGRVAVATAQVAIVSKAASALLANSIGPLQTAATAAVAAVASPTAEVAA